MSVKDFALWVGLLLAIGGPLISYGRLSERQEKNDILLAKHDEDIAKLKENTTLLERIHQLELRIGEMTSELKELRDETRRHNR